MSFHLTPPRTAQPLLASMQKSKEKVTPRLVDYPELALAATATKADLDTNSETFAAVSACLETLCRLKLSAKNTWLLMLLVKHGPTPCSAVADRMKINLPTLNQIVGKLQALSLITAERSGATDRRVTLLTATEAAHKVLASIVGLTGLGAAAAVVLNSKKPRA